jgi:hypothetical protein
MTPIPQATGCPETGNSVTLVNPTVKAATLIAAGHAATSEVSAEVVALTEGVLKTMFLTKLKTVMVALALVAVVAFGAGMLGNGMAAGWQDESKKGNAIAAQKENTGNLRNEKKADPQEPKNVEIDVYDDRKTKKEAKEGTLLAVLEKVDSKEGIITVTRLGTFSGVGDPAKGGLGSFKNNLRLENLPVAKNVRILVNGKDAKLADLKPGMSVSLQLAVKGDITVQRIEDESPDRIQFQFPSGQKK